MGSDCRSVGRAVTSDARGPRFKSSHWQNFIIDIYLFTLNLLRRQKIKKKRPIMAHFLFIKDNDCLSDLLIRRDIVLKARIEKHLFSSSWCRPPSGSHGSYLWNFLRWLLFHLERLIFYKDRWTPDTWAATEWVLLRTFRKPSK